MISNISFKGIPIAKAKTPFNSFKMYKITPEDRTSIEKIQKGINLRELLPGMKHDTYKIWEGVTHAAFSNSLDESTTILLTAESRPCGVMNFSENKFSFDLNDISTWPVKSGEKVPFAGKTLFMELFRRFWETNFSSINLVALKYEPFDPVSKYLKLGFKPLGGNDCAEIMRINRHSAGKTLKMLKQNVSIEPLIDTKNVDLQKELKINA